MPVHHTEEQQAQWLFLGCQEHERRWRRYMKKNQSVRYDARPDGCERVEAVAAPQEKAGAPGWPERRRRENRGM
eukprot:4221299-Pyramimonas_sp.AAC.1